jgi:hypothetical protein
MKNLLLTFLTFICISSIYGQITDPKATEVWEPEPAVVTPGIFYAAPSDAIILFDGKDLSQWQKPQFIHEKGTVVEMKANVDALDNAYQNPAADWTVEAGQFTVKPGTGAIETKEKFGDFQLHLEWLSPEDKGKEGQGYSNSGVFMMSLYEIQVLNSYANRTYSNGQAGSIYKQHIPLVNASRKPGEWQRYDIVFTAPKFNKDGSLKSPAYVTAFHNGVLIQNNVELEGPTAYIGKSEYFQHPEEMPLRLQDHGDLVRYRNIWARKL